MRFKVQGNKADHVGVVVRNVDTVTIKKGAPVFYKASGTVFGLECVSIENLAAGSQWLFAGIAFAEIAAQAYGEAFNYGFFDNIRYILTSRSATGASWLSYSALAIGDLLGFNSDSNVTDHVQAAQYVGNAVVPAVASYASNVSIAAVAAVNNLAYEWAVRAAQTLASSATVASDSTAADAALLYRTTTIKAFIRAL